MIIAYHGCDKTVALKVVSGQEQQVRSVNEYDWLGSGLYFWEDSQARALQWAQEEVGKPNSKIKIPAVLGAVIDLGNCLNLVDSEHLQLVKAAHEAYVTLCAVSGLMPAKNKGKDLKARFLDKAVFETLHKLREDQRLEAFDSVRAFFVEGEPLYENAGLRALDHVQICVRNPKQIIGYFLPR
ncbi:MAG TPA: hypothetical protein VIM44_09335 [Rariglobus sp.]